jgi:hypothetical protein
MAAKWDVMTQVREEHQFTTTSITSHAIESRELKSAF